MKRIVSIQDFSCIGKCSLTVALPVISTMGVECVGVPTALLSAHTMFPGFLSRDLAASLEPTRRHFARMDLRFDAIYTGYLSSAAQVREVCRWLDQFGGGLIFSDPAMGDDGALYPGLPLDFPGEMAKICARADVVVPNITEACMLTGTAYRPDFTLDDLKGLLRRLLELGAKQAILTGVDFGGGRCGVLTADGSYALPRLENGRPGTGDLFASACVGALVQGRTLLDAAAIGADFVAESIRQTLRDPDARWYGTSFERALPFLAARMTKENKDDQETIGPL